MSESKGVGEVSVNGQQQQEVGRKQPLDLRGVIGFNGAVPSGLILHPANRHVIYPLGSTIIVRDLQTNEHTFLHQDGHDNTVSCLSLSPSGKYLVSGQRAHMGFTAPAIVWDLETYEIVYKLNMHKGFVQDVAFSPSEQYVATLGGRDDNKIIIWDMSNGKPISGKTAGNDQAYCLQFYNNDDNRLVTAGAYTLRDWAFDPQSCKLRFTDCKLGPIKRIIRSIEIDASDQFVYAATETGDVLQVSLTARLLRETGPKRSKKSGRGAVGSANSVAPFSQGVTCITLTKKGNIVAGCGDGTIAVILASNMRIVRRCKVDGAITSLSFNSTGDLFYVGTALCNTYLVHTGSFEYELRSTCHHGPVNAVAFPAGYSKLFATCAKGDIRVWHAATLQELLRIQVPNLECLCVCFAPDGRSILSGWNDTRIRAFSPESGSLLYTVEDCHKEAVTSIAMTRDSQHIVSGGMDGTVRVWRVRDPYRVGRRVKGGGAEMVASMKEQKSRINCIEINADDTECVSASSDGSCVVWSLTRYVRVSCVFASTQFRAVLYHPDQSQLLTTGTDRKLTYWDVVDGSSIRIMDGSATGPVNSLAITEKGHLFVSGGADRLLRVWAYDEGACLFVGMGHSDAITQCVISPDQRYIVSVGAEGGILLWPLPDVQFEELPEEDVSVEQAYGRVNVNADLVSHEGQEQPQHQPSGSIDEQIGFSVKKQYEKGNDPNFQESFNIFGGAHSSSGEAPSEGVTNRMYLTRQEEALEEKKYASHEAPELVQGVSQGVMDPNYHSSMSLYSQYNENVPQEQ